MKLLIDVGNSRIKCGWLAEDNTGARREPKVQAFAHDKLEDTLPRWLARLPAPIRAAWGVNVAGSPIADAINRILARHGVAPAHWMSAQPEAWGLVNGYREPHRLGADRWAAMVAVWAHPRYATPVDANTAATQRPATILACFGTATTVDTISPAGRFEGGLILPGTGLMRRALASGTANLPLVNSGESELFPTDTAHAIVSGVLAAQAGAVLRQVLASQERHGGPPRLIVAGGTWPVVQPELRRLMAQTPLAAPLQVADNPVLDGLALLAALPAPGLAP